MVHLFHFSACIAELELNRTNQQRTHYNTNNIIIKKLQIHTVIFTLYCTS